MVPSEEDQVAQKLAGSATRLTRQDSCLQRRIREEDLRYRRRWSHRVDPLKAPDSESHPGQIPFSLAGLWKMHYMPALPPY